MGSYSADGRHRPHGHRQDGHPLGGQQVKNQRVWGSFRLNTISFSHSKYLFLPFSLS